MTHLCFFCAEVDVPEGQAMCLPCKRQVDVLESLERIRDMMADPHGMTLSEYQQEEEWAAHCAGLEEGEEP